MGGGGQVDTIVANNANTALYSTFAVVGFFAGTITNTLGVKIALSFGGLGYCIYIAAFLCYSHTQNEGFNIFAGALLGVCAGLLWTAQGAIMMSYPGEAAKGRYISYFWMIFNLGAVIGSLVSVASHHLPIQTLTYDRFPSDRIYMLQVNPPSRTGLTSGSSFLPVSAPLSHGFWLTPKMSFATTAHASS